MLSPERLPDAMLDHAQELRAESLLAHVIAGGYPREDFTIGTGTFFERAYANDVTDASWQEDAWQAYAALRGRVRVELSRPGFYDLLPEGLFFQPAGAEYNSRMGVTEMAALHRWNKTRENGIRKFFQPFEHAGFYQLLQLEEEERALQQGLEKGMLHRYFRAFWGIPDEVDDRAAGFFNLLIPHAYRITGCLPLMQECLSLLLGLPVKITIAEPGLTWIGRELEKGLGEQSLGDDTVCGNSFVEGYPVYQYAIGPVAGAEVSSFLPGGGRYAVIETFNRFFVPAEADTGMEIAIDRSTVEMRLEAGREPVLGYSTELTE
ncbi:type VI secretion system baseplate subunit TssG [Puia sp.]|uniref:type VI secretion system baseplate subunit TssG n=1 Tax=Puia sp. TaxID=2045100 RepID=UPI002F41495D